jgi:hypothetical protein
MGRSGRRSLLRGPSFELRTAHDHWDNREPPLIVDGADKQRSLRCTAALIITSCASVSLTLMIQPFLSS